MLYIIPTPIGNLNDITLRSIEILKISEYIYCEDTRTSSKLLKHYGIESKLKAYHMHNEHKILQNIIDELLSNKVISIISDAGTPGISDPGFLIVREAIKNNIEVCTLPGPTAFVPALINSGFSTNKFYFVGFLPQKKGRLKEIQSLINLENTIIIYESPYRVIKLLEQILEVFDQDRNASFSREISKIYEETKRGKISQLIDYLKSKDKIKGEFVICIEGNKS